MVSLRGLTVQMDIKTLGEHLVGITLIGRLDTQGVDGVETRLTAAIVPEGNSAIVDLTHVEFIASMGIRMLLSLARSLKMRHARVAIYGAATQVSEVFETVALQQLIPICTTEAEALAAVTAPLA
jgi:anti-sigma B factor antagonist